MWSENLQRHVEWSTPGLWPVGRIPDLVGPNPLWGLASWGHENRAIFLRSVFPASFSKFFPFEDDRVSSPRTDPEELHLIVVSSGEKALGSERGSHPDQTLTLPLPQLEFPEEIQANCQRKTHLAFKRFEK